MWLKHAGDRKDVIGEGKIRIQNETEVISSRGSRRN